MDDPLFLVMQGIFLLAAGMYPLGFLFGACSECCGCPPCNDCTHRFKGGDINAPGDQFGCSAPVDITIETSAGAVTFQDYRVDFEDPKTVNTIGSCNGNDLVVSLRQINVVFPAPADECGCFGCGYQPVLRFTRPGAFVEETLDAVLLLGACSQTSDSGEKDFSATIALLVCSVADAFIRITISTDPCECGACCYEDNSCTDNIPEFYCEDPVGFFGVAQGTWQGVGTSCDPNPCEE